MDTALSDLLTCPRCGPDWGLILLPAEVRESRVVAGFLGCANCRERYPVERGVADLRVTGTGSEPVAAGGAGDRESAVRLAALLGLAEARGTVLVAGPMAVHAGELSSVVPDVEVVAVDGEPGARVSALRVTGVLPVRSRSLGGVVLSGGRAELLEEGARVLGPGGRLVLEPAPDDAVERVAAAGLVVVVEEGGAVVAERRP
jgi:uncharacterized protein YbaR (Trm112 family)